MSNDPFTDPDVADQEVSRALEIATKHIEDAEDVLWTVAEQAGSHDHISEIEDITSDIWEIQNRLTDMQEKVD